MKYPQCQKQLPNCCECDLQSGYDSNLFTVAFEKILYSFNSKYEEFTLSR